MPGDIIQMIQTVFRNGILFGVIWKFCKKIILRTDLVPKLDPQVHVSRGQRQKTQTTLKIADFEFQKLTKHEFTPCPVSDSVSHNYNKTCQQNKNSS